MEPCSSDVTAKPPGIWNKVKRLLDLDLLLDPTFINIMFSCGLVFTSNQNFNMLFPFYLQVSSNLILHTKAFFFKLVFLLLYKMFVFC